MSSISDLALAAELARGERPSVPLAVATLFAVDGSSYRQPGARLLIDVEGRVLAGAISGGCLEGDVASHAKAVCETGLPKLLTYDLGDDLQAIWGFGAMCDGVAHLLVEPLRDGAWLTDAHRMRAARDHGALITVLDESPLGGTVESLNSAMALRIAARSLIDAAHTTASPVCDVIVLHGQHVRCLVDPVVPPVSLVIIGAGRGAETFATIAHAIGWRITLIDHRPFVLDSVDLPSSVLRVAAHPVEGVQQIPTDERSAIALLTHQFAIDREWLSLVLPLDVGYVGVLGSRQRAAQLLQSLSETGFDVTARMRRVLHAPIGLDLGGESPESIALASIAEIEATMNGRPGGSLRERQSPIHTRTETPHVRS